MPPIESGTNDSEFARECVPETPNANQLRKRTHGSVTNLRSQKRRRISLASVDLSRELQFDIPVSVGKHTGSTVDRFVSNRPKTFLPLNITPRTRRISKQFGLVDEKVLNFRDDTRINSSTNYRDENTMGLLRRSASSLFQNQPSKHSSSVTENLNKRKDCLMVLDSPGVTPDPNAFPISWSRRNLIAVVCKNDIFYQNLNTKAVSHLCTSSFPGIPSVIRWAGEGLPNYLACGDTKGSTVIWDAGSRGAPGTRLHTWFSTDNPVTSLSWNESVLATGSNDGGMALIDIRAPTVYSGVKKHRAPLLGLEWSVDGAYLASGDRDGIVHIWDRRAGKVLLDTEDPITKVRHTANARALAWCPWKPDLLATGTTSPEGKIRIWSTTSISSHSPTPVQTIPLNTSVLSLHWSPHCKELLSTHGLSFLPPSQLEHRSASRTTKLIYAKTPLVNSIAVHHYPSGKRLMTLTNAHTSPVTSSCLSPNGECVFTVCPKEETIKMWKVWSERPKAEKRESAFDKYTIR